MGIDLDALVIGPVIDTFGQSVTYYPFTATLDGSGARTYDDDGKVVGTIGVGYPATGVFDNQFVEIGPSGGNPYPGAEGDEWGTPGSIGEVMPVLGVRLSAMQTIPATQDQIQIGTVRYEVRQPRPDGHGWCKLLLMVAP